MGVSSFGNSQIPYKAKRLDIQILLLQLLPFHVCLLGMASQEVGASSLLTYLPMCFCQSNSQRSLCPVGRTVIRPQAARQPFFLGSSVQTLPTESSLSRALGFFHTSFPCSLLTLQPSQRMPLHPCSPDPSPRLSTQPCPTLPQNLAFAQWPDSVLWDFVNILL